MNLTKEQILAIMFRTTGDKITPTYLANRFGDNLDSVHNLLRELDAAGFIYHRSFNDDYKLTALGNTKAAYIEVTGALSKL